MVGTLNKQPSYTNDDAIDRRPERNVLLDELSTVVETTIQLKNLSYQVGKYSVMCFREYKVFVSDAGNILDWLSSNSTKNAACEMIPRQESF